MTLIGKEGAGWIGRARFEGKEFDSVVSFVSRVFQYCKLIYVDCLTFDLWFALAWCGLFIFMVYWK